MANVQNMSASKRKCVGCGVELSGNAPPDLCPKCLHKLAMETQPGTVAASTLSLPGPAPKSRGLPQPGEQFGHYSIIGLLGAGGMGAVYEAQDLESGRRLALKVLSHTLDSPHARERFFREGRLAASINHPNSVYVFGTDEIDGTPVIAMELVSGGTLQDRVRTRGALAIGEAVDCARQIIAGLEAAEQLGILHRDIKPSNCYVGEDGTVKIGDFGLSISTTVRTEPTLTATGVFLGTPVFCSPEQMRGEELNARSDMYSVGATVYYLLTGQTPFESTNTVQLLAAVLEQRAPSPRNFRAEIPQGLAKVVLRCLEKQPGERFRNYADLTQALAPYSSTAPTPATMSLRFAAGLVDMVILGSLSFAINLSGLGTAMGFVQQAMNGSPKVLVCVIGWVCATTLYYAFFEGRWGAAVGKALCGLRVVGLDGNPPGVRRAWFRALLFVIPPFLPFGLVLVTIPKVYFGSSPLTQLLLELPTYAIMALLFVTARRHNGFAAVQDLLTGTRVISRATIILRPTPSANEAPPALAESAATIGPYHVLQPLADLGGEKWFLAYDLRLLRKVWIRMAVPGTAPVPLQLRNLGRAGRLRWLAGKRSPHENWDAFEALSGRAFLELTGTPQPWREVRYWLNDLAIEISAAEKDGTLPELALDRVWITGDGRVKLLDFPAPGLASRIHAQVQLFNSFLSTVATSALLGNPDGSRRAAVEVAVPLPLHARAFLEGLPRMAGADEVATALKPLLSRVAAVSQLRRAALVAGCLIVPLIACGAVFLVLSFLQELTRKNPGLMDLHTLLEQRTSAKSPGGDKAQLPTDRQIALYLAHHYRSLITNEASWSNPMVLQMIKGESRRFAEQSVLEHPALTEAEIAEAETTVGKSLPKKQFFAEKPSPPLVLEGSLLLFVCFPALAAALLCHGGVVLLIAGVTYTRKDGARVSRLRLLWRWILTWCPLILVFIVSILALNIWHLDWELWLPLVLLGLLAVWSVALPERGIQDRLAGTWPVPR
jgi:uncharacterized RDD family membrane protein YckC